MTGNRADAAELMQDAFLKLWERWDTIDRIDDPTAYPVPRGAQRVSDASARRPGAIVALAAVIPTASAGTALQPLHITKECSEFTGETPSFCTITGSDLAAIPVGTKAFYWGPVLTDPNFISSRTVLRAGHGNRAFGYCQTIADPYHGTCVFWRGTGTLHGFHASVDVTIDSGGVFHWDGTNLFD